MSASCGLCERALEDGYLCVGCTKDLRVRLEELPRLYDELGLLLPPGRGEGGRSSKGGPPPLPLREDVLDLRMELQAVLASWAAAVRADRRRGEPVRAAGRVGRAAGELLAHLPWVAVSWPQAGVLAEEMKGLAASAVSVVGPAVEAVRGLRIGNCPAQFEDEVICGAVLRLHAGAKVVTCEWCSTSYPPATWSGLKTLMDADAKAAADAA